jgi:hypothetical protein
MLEWTLDLCFPGETVQLLNAEAIRWDRLDELIDSARESDSRDLSEVNPRLK